jgi:hypothetical protein
MSIITHKIEKRLEKEAKNGKLNGIFLPRGMSCAEQVSENHKWLTDCRLMRWNKKLKIKDNLLTLKTKYP